MRALIARTVLQLSLFERDSCSHSGTGAFGKFDPFVIWGIVTSGTENYLHKFVNHVARLSRLLTDLIVITTMNTNSIMFRNKEWIDKAEEPGLAQKIGCNSADSDSHFC